MAKKTILISLQTTLSDEEFSSLISDPKKALTLLDRASIIHALGAEEVVQLNDLSMVVQFPSEEAKNSFFLSSVARPIGSLEEALHSLKNTASDINEHLDYLAALARGKYVVEFGTRTAVSTVALASTCKELKTFDIDKASIERARVLFSAHPEVSCQVASTLDNPDIGMPDMLFIDTLHTYTQLKEELRLHGNKATQILAFHDTETFGEIGEDGKSPGLLEAIDEFLADCPWWSVLEKRKNNNGLMVLQRA